MASLLQLLGCPQYFSATDPPNLAQFRGIRLHVEAQWLEVATGSARNLFLPEEAQAICEIIAAAEIADRADPATNPYLCPVDIAAYTARAPLQDQGPVFDPRADIAIAIPPISGAHSAPADFEKVPEIKAMSLLREALKALLVAVDLPSHAVRPARIPDPWAHAAWKLACGKSGDRSLLGTSEMARAHGHLAEWTREMDEDLVAYLQEYAMRKEKSMHEIATREITIGVRDRAAFGHLAFCEDESVQVRASLLVLLNRAVSRCIRLVDARAPLGEASVGSLLRKLSHLVFPDAV